MSDNWIDSLPTPLMRGMDRTSPGWERMWGEIKAQYGDTVCLHDGEAWQYMGSYSEDGGATWHHEFRHRALPPLGRRTCVHVPALPGDFSVTQEGERP